MTVEDKHAQEMVDAKTLSMDLNAFVMMDLKEQNAKPVSN